MVLTSLGVLLMVLIILGLRSYQVGVLVLPSEIQSPAEATIGRAADTPMLSLAYKDSLLSTAEACDRNPFGPPPARRRTPPRVRQEKPEPEDETPSLAALLYDNVEPAVQLKYKTSVSTWLREGESFRGWVIVEISSNSVTILKDGKSVVLE